MFHAWLNYIYCVMYQSHIFPLLREVQAIPFLL
jgi:hypothetical protein